MFLTSNLGILIWEYGDFMNLFFENKNGDSGYISIPFSKRFSPLDF